MTEEAPIVPALYHGQPKQKRSGLACRGSTAHSVFKFTGRRILTALMEKRYLKNVSFLTVDGSSFFSCQFSSLPIGLFLSSIIFSLYFMQLDLSCLQWVGCDNRTCRRWVHVDCEVSAGNKVDSTAFYLCPSCREVAILH